MHRGAFWQFTFMWIHYYDSNKSIGLETGKSRLCAVYCCCIDIWCCGAREVIVVEGCCFGEARHQGGGMMVMRFTATVFIIRLFWSR